MFFDLSKKYNNIPNNSHVRCCQFILVGDTFACFCPYRSTLSFHFKQLILLAGNAEKSVTNAVKSVSHTFKECKRIRDASRYAYTPSSISMRESRWPPPHHNSLI